MWYQRSLGWWIAVDRTVSRMSSKLKLRLRDYQERGHSTWAAIWRDLGTRLHRPLDLIRTTHKTSPPMTIFQEDQWRRLGNTSPRPGDHKKWKAALPLLVDEILAYNFFCQSRYSTSRFRAPGHLLFSSFLLVGSQDHQSNMPVFWPYVQSIAVVHQEFWHDYVLDFKTITVLTCFCHLVSQVLVQNRLFPTIPNSHGCLHWTAGFLRCSVWTILQCS